MAFRRLTAATLFFLAMGHGRAEAAAPPGPADCTWVGSPGCTGKVPGGGNGNASGTLGSGEGGPPIFRWERENFGKGVFAGDSGFCPGPNADDPSEGAGDWVIVSMYLIATGEGVWNQPYCVYENEPWPPPPPPPPTGPEMVQDQDDLFRVEPELMPPPRGEPALNGTGTSIGALVNRAMYAWCEQPGDVDVGVQLRGWTAEATFKVVALKWSVGGGDGASTTTGASSCGSRPPLGKDGVGAAWKWTPNKKGAYVINLTAVWTGEATYAYLGQPVGSASLGEREYNETANQTVIEMQALNN